MNSSSVAPAVDRESAVVAAPIASPSDGNSSTRGRMARAAMLALSTLGVLVIFRAYLVPNVWPSGFDAWRDVGARHLGLSSTVGAALAACTLAIVVFASYIWLVAKDSARFGLWLLTGVWLSLTIAAVALPGSEASVATREANLLLGYVGGLAAARLFRRVDAYVIALVACGAVQCTIAIAYRVAGSHTLQSGSVIRAGGTFGSPSLLYLVPLFILPIAVQGILSSKTTIRRTFFMVCASIMLAALILTWERSGFAAALVGLFWIARKHISVRSQAVCLALLLLPVFGAFYVRSAGPVNAASSARSIQSRAALAQTGTLTFAHHWLDGVGVGRLSLPVQVRVNNHAVNVFMLNPYNQYLFWLDEMGIIALALVAAMAACVWRTIRMSDSVWAPGVAAVWVSVMLAGLFNTIIGSAELGCGNMLFGSLLGLTMRLGNGTDARTRIPA